MILYYITDRRAFPGTEAEKRERLLAKIGEASRAGVDFIQLREKDLCGRELERLALEAVEVVRENALAPSPKGERCGTPSGLGRRTKILINSRVDVALAVGADGVHLTSNDIPASEARAVWARSLRLTSGAKAPATDDADGTAKAVPFPRSDFGGKARVVSNTSRAPEAASFTSMGRAVPFASMTVAVSCHTVQEVRLAEAHGADFAVFAPVFEKSVVASSSANVRKEAGIGAEESSERGRDVHATAGGTPALQRQGDTSALQRQAGTAIQRHTVVRRSPEEGLDALRKACRSLAFPNNVEGVGSSTMPVLALGGVTVENASECLAVGASGIAGIRLFQENDISEIVRRLK